jgi:hypothetical protein
MKIEGSKGRAPTQQCLALRFETREDVELKSAIYLREGLAVRQHAYMSQTWGVVTDGWMR